jgi:hypothetical protein
MIGRVLRRSLLAGMISAGALAAPPLGGVLGPWLAGQAQAEEGVRVPDDICAWQTANWADMNAAEQAAWEALGWTGTMWESDNPDDYPATEYKAWADLTQEESTAAAQLGFDQNSWDNIEDVCTSN